MDKRTILVKHRTDMHRADKLANRALNRKNNSRVPKRFETFHIRTLLSNTKVS